MKFLTLHLANDRCFFDNLVLICFPVSEVSELYETLVILLVEIQQLVVEELDKKHYEININCFNDLCSAILY